MNKKFNVVFGLLCFAALLLVVLFFGNREDFGGNKNQKKGNQKKGNSKKDPIPVIRVEELNATGCTGEGAIIENRRFLCFTDPMTDELDNHYAPTSNGECPGNLKATPHDYFKNIKYCA